MSSTTASCNCIRRPKQHFWHTEEHEIKWLIHSLYRWEEKHDEFKKVRLVFKTMNTKSCEDDSCETIPERWHEVLLQIIVLCQWKTPLYLVLVVLLYESTSAGKMELHKSKTETKTKSSLVLGRKLLFNFLLQLMLAALFHMPVTNFAQNI